MTKQRADQKAEQMQKIFADSKAIEESVKEKIKLSMAEAEKRQMEMKKE